RKFGAVCVEERVATLTVIVYDDLGVFNLSSLKTPSCLPLPLPCLDKRLIMRRISSNPSATRSDSARSLSLDQNEEERNQHRALALSFITPQQEAQFLVGDGVVCGISQGLRALLAATSTGAAGPGNGSSLTAGGPRQVVDAASTGCTSEDYVAAVSPATILTSVVDQSFWTVFEPVEFAPWVQNPREAKSRLQQTMNDNRGCMKWVSTMRIAKANQSWCIVRARSVWMGGCRYVIVSLHKIPETRLDVAQTLCQEEVLTKGVVTDADLEEWMAELEKQRELPELKPLIPLHLQPALVPDDPATATAPKDRDVHLFPPRAAGAGSATPVNQSFPDPSATSPTQMANS
ncbi:unnamed protein product, partial [Amoebophrya sp. A120]